MKRKEMKNVSEEHRSRAQEIQGERTLCRLLSAVQALGRWGGRGIATQ